MEVSIQPFRNALPSIFRLSLLVTDCHKIAKVLSFFFKGKVFQG